MVACSWNHTSSSHDKFHHGLFPNTRQLFLLTWVFTAASQTPAAFLTRLPMYSPKIDSSKKDGCRHPSSISIRKQDDSLTLLKCRIEASQVSALSSVFVGPHTDTPQHSRAVQIFCIVSCKVRTALDLLLSVWKHWNGRPSCSLTRDARRRKMPCLFQ